MYVKEVYERFPDVKSLLLKDIFAYVGFQVQLNFSVILLSQKIIGVKESSLDLVLNFPHYFLMHQHHKTASFKPTTEIIKKRDNKNLPITKQELKSEITAQGLQTQCEYTISIKILVKNYYEFDPELRDFVEIFTKHAREFWCAQEITLDSILIINYSR